MNQRKFKTHFASTNISNEFKNSVIKKDSLKNIQRRKHQQYRKKKKKNLEKRKKSLKRRKKRNQKGKYQKYNSKTNNFRNLAVNTHISIISPKVENENIRSILTIYKSEKNSLQKS